MQVKIGSASHTVRPATAKPKVLVLASADDTTPMNQVGRVPWAILLVSTLMKYLFSGAPREVATLDQGPPGSGPNSILALVMTTGLASRSELFALARAMARLAAAVIPAAVPLSSRAPASAAA